MAHSRRVSLTFLHAHLGWIFSPIWVSTFHPTDNFEEHKLDSQMHAHCATRVTDVGKKKSEPFLRVNFTLAQREQTACAARGQCEHPPSLCASTPPCSAQGAGLLCARCRVALGEAQGRSAQGSGSLCARVSLQKREGQPPKTRGSRKCPNEFCEMK